jgi:hypothetical protein
MFIVSPQTVRTFTAKLFVFAKRLTPVRRGIPRAEPDIRYTHAQRTALFDFCQDFRNLAIFVTTCVRMRDKTARTGRG